MGREILAVFPGVSLFRTGGRAACSGCFVLPASRTSSVDVGHGGDVVEHGLSSRRHGQGLLSVMSGIFFCGRERRSADD